MQEEVGEDDEHHGAVHRVHVADNVAERHVRQAQAADRAVLAGELADRESWEKYDTIKNLENLFFCFKSQIHR